MVDVAKTTKMRKDPYGPCGLSASRRPGFSGPCTLLIDKNMAGFREGWRRLFCEGGDAVRPSQER